MLHVFWFGLEILRLVYKKCFLKYCTVSILFDLLSSEKSSTAPYKSWKKLFKIVHKGYQRSGISLWFKKCAEVLSLSKGEKIFAEKLIFPASKRSTHFLNQRQIPGDLCLGMLCQESPSTASLTYLQVIFMVIFTVECFAKIIAYGFWQHEEAYLRLTIFFTSKTMRKSPHLNCFSIASWVGAVHFFINKEL